MNQELQNGNLLISFAKKQLSKDNDWDFCALVLILASNICLYTSETLMMFMACSGLGILLALWNHRGEILSWLKPDSVVVWLTVMYAMYMMYGLFYLRAGEFNWDVIAFRYVENIAMYAAVSGMLRKGNEKIASPFIVAGIISLLFLLVAEKENILSGNLRIGDALSGNVNTVGYCFGLVSIFVTWSFCVVKKKWKLVLLALLMAIMLMTGSKKVLIILAVDALLFFAYAKNKKAGVLILLGIGVVGAVVIFAIPYFYEIIGSRVVDMILSLFGLAQSYSTSSRLTMIQEGLLLFVDHPFLGGGMNYFLSQSSTGMYSHCNYIEMLCTFGLLGAVLYYGRIVLTAIGCSKYLAEKQPVIRDGMLLSLALLGAILMLEIAAVTFTAQSIWYVPIITAGAALDHVREISHGGAENG